MRAVQRLFIIALAFVVSLGIAIGIFLYVSLIPYVSLIGKVAAGLIMLGLACAGALLIVLTWTTIGNMLSRRRRERLHERLIVAGDVVAYLSPTGEFEHLSARHEEAKVIPQVTVKEIQAPAPSADKDTVLELLNLGLSYRDISTRTGVSYHYVQKWAKELADNKYAPRAITKSA
jgi:uncharacterized protein YerC